jgi:uncharacterized membrane protein YcaP (DUF421 family)
MEIIKELFGDSDNINPFQMAFRMVIIFIVGILLIRLAGKRTFSMNMSIDNVITIMMGGILTRGIDGKNSFLGVVACATTIVVLYRLVIWGCLKSQGFGKLIKGEEKLIYKEGEFDKKVMKKFMMTEKDVTERVRITGHLNSLDEIKQIYVERDGEISFIKKEE